MITLKCATEEQHRRGLLQICQDVHMTLLGTYERNHETGWQDMDADIQYLRDVMNGWEDPYPSTDGHLSVFLQVSQSATAAYDQAVRALVVATLAEVLDYAERQRGKKP